MRIAMLALVLTAVSTLSIQAAEENPYAKAKVGDWVHYVSKSKFGPAEMEGEQRWEVIEKTADTVTVEMTIKQMGQEMKNKFTVKLNEEYKPEKQMAQGAEVKELGTGSEKLTVGGKSLDTKWTHYQMTMKAGGATIETKTKVWVSPEIPLSGMAKMVSEMAQGSTTMELKDFGSK